MSWPRAALLLLCCFADVRVRARTLLADGARIELSTGAVIERSGAGWDLIRGDALVHSVETFGARVPYASVACAGPCVAILSRAGDHLTLMNLGGDWTFTPVGASSAESLAVGLSMRLGEVDPTIGRVPPEFPLGLPWASTLKLWSALEVAGLDVFRSDVRGFRPKWAESVEAASAAEAAAAGRLLRARAERLRDAGRRRGAEARGDAALRALFAQKTLY